jgi:ubiquinol-cytochrome c reductase iron-sulfur subunit
MTAISMHGGTTTAQGGMTRRDFLYVAAGAFTGVGAIFALWPLLDSLNPSADVQALSTTDVDLGPIQIGQRVTVLWQGKPVFIDHRTPQAIARALADDRSPTLLDPATDEARVKRKQWLIVVGVCTHLGCVPLGQRPTDNKGQWGGWYCPCHGSQYDESGRVRHGPAPRNLAVPPYFFASDTRVVIGQSQAV